MERGGRERDREHEGSFPHPPRRPLSFAAPFAAPWTFLRPNSHFSPQLHNRFPHDGGQGCESIGGPRERWSAGCRRGVSAASAAFFKHRPSLSVPGLSIEVVSIGRYDPTGTRKEVRYSEIHCKCTRNARKYNFARTKPNCNRL